MSVLWLQVIFERARSNYSSLFVRASSAFATTGLLLTSAVFMLVMLQSYTTCTYVMESCARAELLALSVDTPDELIVSLPVIGNRKFELPELSRIFLGEVWRLIFTVTTYCNLYGLTWSLAAVFASSLSSDFSIRDDQDDYFIFIIIFAAIVIPMAFVPIIDQVWVQLVFFAGRMIMVVVMLATTAAAYVASEPHFGDQAGPQRTAPLANFRTLHL